jgi:hypothetical protein
VEDAHPNALAIEPAVHQLRAAALALDPAEYGLRVLKHEDREMAEGESA